jgi:hypothetical protein
MRYLLDTSAQQEPVRPIDDEAFRVCLDMLHMQMRLPTEEDKREKPTVYKPLVYLYR